MGHLIGVAWRACNRMLSLAGWLRDGLGAHGMHLIGYERRLHAAESDLSATIVTCLVCPCSALGCCIRAGEEACWLG